MGAILLAAALGGAEWALFAALGVVCALATRHSVISVLGVSLLWLGLFLWSGDRRLYFPFAMQIASQIPYLAEGRLQRPWLSGGGGAVLFFLAIRFAQSATTQVLTVEAIVAVAILLLLLAVRGHMGRMLAGTAGSILAFVGLIF